MVLTTFLGNSPSNEFSTAPMFFAMLIHLHCPCYPFSLGYYWLILRCLCSYRRVSVAIGKGATNDSTAKMIIYKMVTLEIRTQIADLLTTHGM